MMSSVSSLSCDWRCCSIEEASGGIDRGLSCSEIHHISVLVAISQQLAQRQPTVTRTCPANSVNPVGQSTVRGGRRGRFEREQANHRPTSTMLRSMQVQGIPPTTRCKSSIIILPFFVEISGGTMTDEENESIAMAECGACRAVIPIDSTECPECATKFSGVSEDTRGVRGLSSTGPPRLDTLPRVVFSS